MAVNKINMKQILEDLKSLLTKEMKNNANKVTEKIVEKRNTKFVKVSTIIETIDSKTEGAELLAKNNQNNISKNASESTALQNKLPEQTKKIHELEENINGRISSNPNDTVAIGVIKK